MTPEKEAEANRLSALKNLLVMDSPEEQAYDDITRFAASICGTPIALISLVDDKRQWFKARVGLAARETPRDMAFCAHAIAAPQQVMMVEDAQADSRFAENPLVTGEPKIRFYAGAPLVTKDSQVLGTLCVIDRVPRTLDAEQLQTLQFMAAQVMAMLEAKAGTQIPIGAAVDRSNSASIARLRKVIADERSSSPAGTDTLRLLTERMRGYEKGVNLAPSLSEFMEWRNMVELEKARTRFAQAKGTPD